MQVFVAYLRVSTDKQGVFGLGMEAQREAVSRYVQNRGQIVSEYVEVESGKKSNRPQLTAALAECRRHRAILVIAKLDRLARNVHFISGLMNSDVDFVAVDMPTANRLTIHILAAVAEHEREMISERTKAALASARTRGVKLGNPRAAEALIKARAALGMIPIAPDVISLLVDWRSDGLTLREIAAKLNRLSIPSSRGLRWHGSTVSSTIDRYHESQKARTPDRPKALKDECVLSSSSLNSSLNAIYSQAIPSVSLSSAGRESKTEGVKAMYDLDEAYRMLDTFVGSGAMHFDVTFNDIDGEKCGFRPSQTARQLRSSLPHLIPGLRERQQNIIIRPKSEKVVFIQLDDLPEDQVHRLVPVACLSIQTSPGNHQSWVAVADLPGKAEAKDFSRRLRKGVGADPEASGATRLAGTPNFKTKIRAVVSDHTDHSPGARTHCDPAAARNPRLCG